MNIKLKIKTLILIIFFSASECFASIESSFQFAKTLYLEDQNLRSLTLSDYLISSGDAIAPELKFKITIVQAVNLYRLGDTLLAIDTLNNLLPTENKQKEKVQDLKEFISNSYSTHNLKLYSSELEENSTNVRSPLIAGLLSTAIPGLGLAYSGAYQSAIFSFVINAITGLATVELAKKDLDTTAIASGVVFSFFYFGNIYASVETAQNINKNYNLNLTKKLQKKYIPLLYLDF